MTTRLAVSLANYEIGLSGAIPSRSEWREPAMDRAILEFVGLFSGLVLKYGGRIVHGCHPTFTPIILRQARLHAGDRERKPLTLVMSDLWAQELSDSFSEAVSDVAEFVVTRVSKGETNVETRNHSLSAMRRVLIDAQNVMVAVGGKLHSYDGKIPGVAEEMELAQRKGIPRFLVGGLGGFSEKLASVIDANSLRNFLSPDDNRMLLNTQDVTACVGTLFHHLTGSKALAEAATQPIRWNAQLQAVVDHRDGTIDRTSTDLILHPIAA